MPPAPALRIPPNSTSSMISTALATAAHTRWMPNRLVIIADDDSTWDTMLMKIPTRNSIEPMVSALCPYSRLTTSSNVVQPLRRNVPA